MKMFIVSVILLCVMITGAIINYYYVEALTSEMLYLTSLMPELDEVMQEGYTASDAVRAPSRLWEENTDRLSLTMNQKYITAISNAANNVYEYYRTKEISEYCAARKQLVYSLEILRNTEHFSLFGII